MVNSSNLPIIQQPIILAGGRGYLGSIIRDHLTQNNQEFSLLTGELEVARRSSTFGNLHDIVLINCIGNTGNSPQASIEQDFFENKNVKTVTDLVELFAGRISNFIQISSTSIASDATTPYAKSKLEADYVLSQLSRDSGFQLNTLICPSIWSRRKLKEGSLLETLSKSKLKSDFTELRNPFSEISVCSDRTFLKLLDKAISNDRSETHYLQDTVKFESTLRFIQALQGDCDHVFSPELIELAEIYEFWRSH